jgi:indoleamine 2,3-dioxygenase
MRFVCRMRGYLADMRAHMPPSHRAFLLQLEAGPSVREAVQTLAQTTSNSSSSSTVPSSSSSNRGGSSLVEVYDAAVAELERFRSQHRAFAIAYIAQWSKKEAKEVGTGGSDFVPALTYKDATAAHKLAGSNSSSSSRGCPLHS